MKCARPNPSTARTHTPAGRPILIFAPLGRKGAHSSGNRRPERIHTARRRQSWIWDTYGACAQPRLASYGYKFNCIDKYTIFWVNALTMCVTNNKVQPRRRLL